MNSRQRVDVAVVDTSFDVHGCSAPVSGCGQRGRA